MKRNVRCCRPGRLSNSRRGRRISSSPSCPCRETSGAVPRGEFRRLSFETPQGFFNCLPHRLDGSAPAMRPAQWLRYNPVDDCEVLQIPSASALLRHPGPALTTAREWRHSLRDYRINGMPSISTSSAVARAMAPPEPPSPTTTATTGTSSCRLTSMHRAMASAWPRSSAPTPG